jgi:hypothetical protein
MDGRNELMIDYVFEFRDTQGQGRGTLQQMAPRLLADALFLE